MHNLALIPSPANAAFAPDLIAKDGPAKRHGRCRQQVLEEVVIGFFWIYLDLPADITGIEIEGLARKLIGRIREGADEAAITLVLNTHQRCAYGRPVNANVMRKLAQQVVTAVKGC
jgi:hypothetical protein